MIKQIFIALTIFSRTVVFSQANDKENVLALEKNTADAFIKHNILFLNTVFADDVVIIGVNGDVSGKQQMLQSVQNVNSIILSGMQAKVEGSIAIVTGLETEKGKDNFAAYSITMRFTDVLRKKNSKWQIINSQATAVK